MLIYEHPLTHGRTVRFNPEALVIEESLTQRAYQWLRNGQEIGGAVQDNYEIAEEDLGHQISLKISFVDNAGLLTTHETTAVEISDEIIHGAIHGAYESFNVQSGDYEGLSTSQQSNDAELLPQIEINPVSPAKSITSEASQDPIPQPAQSDVRASMQLSLSGSKITNVTVTFTDQQGEQVKNIPAGSVDLSASTSMNDLKVTEGAYQADIDLSDVLTTLKHIVGLRPLDGKAFAAADANNDQSVDLSDVLTQLKHIVGLRKIDTFDVLDSDGNPVTDLQATTSPLEIVLNGDADLSSALKDDYKFTANLSPTLIVPTGGSVTEDASTSTITGTLSSTDPEGESPTYSVVSSTATEGSYSVTGTYGTLVLNASTGAYTYTLNNAATATNALTASDSKTESFSVQVTDGTNTPAAQSLSVTIQGANDAPSVTVSGLTDIAENETNAIVATVSGSDVEDGAVAVALSGNGRDDTAFEIVDGKLRIKASADYEAQDNYQVQLSVTDSGGASTARNLEFNVSDASEAMSGSVVDGYVAGATIFQDLNNDNVLDSNEPYTVTSSTGDFVLFGIVASKTAPLKMISGFDIGTNQPIVTTLGVPTTLSGNAVASPIATLTSISQSENAESNLSDVLGRVASYFDISATSQSKANILNDDPIENLTSSDSDTASAAEDVFEANQFIMGLTHISEKAGRYLADQIDAAVQNAGDNSYGTYAGGAVSSYEKLGADAFLNTASNHIMTPFAPISDNAFQINSAQLKWNDYHPSLDADVINRAEGITADGTMSFNGGSIPLNLQNLTNGANDSGSYKSASISFELLKVPDGSGSGTVTVNLISGSDGTRSSGEQQFNFDIAVNWSGDGNTAALTVPAQTLSGFYYTADDLRIDFTVENSSPDVINIDQTGFGNPTSLDIKLDTIISRLDGFGADALLSEGDLNLSISTDLPLRCVNGNTLTAIETTLSLAQNTPLEVFIEDVSYFEDDASPIATVYLNRPHTEDVKVTYDVAASGTNTATAESDFTAQSAQTVTILAGLTSANVALPILSDSSVESAETFSVTATAVSAGSLKKATGTVTLEDSDTTVSTGGELDSLASDVVTSMANDISAALLTAYQSAATSASASLTSTSSSIATAAATVTSGLTTVMKAFYGIVSTEITTAATNNTAAADFAQALMTANSATKLFDPSTIIGTYINGDGTYIGANDLTSLTAAIQSEYDTFKTYASETVGDVFGTDTATNFAGAVVNMLTTGNDAETLTSASEIIPTFDGTDTVSAGGGNDKVIGGNDVDTFYGQDGNDHLYGFRGNDILDGGDGNDKIVGGLGDDQISGGAGDDYILAQTGDDTISTGTGTDEVAAGLGDDAITIDGTGTKTIDGGSGTDGLVISYSGVSSITDFSNIDYNSSTSTLTFTDTNGGTISAQGMETFTVGSTAYSFVDNNGYHSTSGNTRSDFTYAFIRSDGNEINFITPSSGSTQLNMTEAIVDFVPASATWLDEALSINGSAASDNITDGDGNNLNNLGALTVNADDGDDIVKITTLTENTDTINLGAGDDIVYVGSDYATDVLNGGSGADWFALHHQQGNAGSGLTYTINSGNSSNFENVGGTVGDDNLTGDANANTIFGGKGADIITAGEGNDIVIGDIGTSGSSLSLGSLTYDHNGSGNDKLYGGAGNDDLYGDEGDDTLDGGTGADTIYTGSGSDTVVLRTGDGGSTLAAADIIKDFTDGTDVLGMDDGLQYADLNIAQGTGDNASDTIISSGSEYLAILQGISVSALSGADFMSTSTSSQTFTGDNADNTYIGGAGNDTFSGNAGSDTIYAHSGDDTINVNNKSGAYADVINGGSGTDGLVISYSGVSSITDFSNIDYNSSTSTLTFTDTNGGTISAQGMETFTVGSTAYSFVDNNGYHSTSGNTRSDFTYAFIRSDGNEINFITPSSGSTQLNMTEAIVDFVPASATWLDEALSINGSAASDNITDGDGNNLNNLGALTVNADDGDDIVKITTLTENTDTINLGAGDDIVYVGSDYATDVLNGGSGADWFALHHQQGNAGSGLTYTINSGNSSNFENVGGTVGDDNLTGDANANTIFGGKGADIITAGEGNDIVIGDIGTSGSSLSLGSLTYDHNGSGNDKLYGGAGNDDLYGDEGDDTLDGGTGADTIYTGSGSDTVVLRTGDGGSTLAAADIIKDFTDGTDVLGMDDGLQYADLNIAQGTGDNASDTIISSGSEYLAILQGISVSALSGADFMSTSTSSQTFTGDNADNTYIGGAGNDTFSGNAGSDTIYAHSGDDTINVNNKSGAYADVINGGSGTDGLVISYSGVSSITDFSNIDYNSSTSTLTFTDTNGGTISAQGMETFTVGSTAYSFVDNNGYHSTSGNTRSDFTYAFIRSDGNEINFITPSSGSTQLNMTEAIVDFVPASATWLDEALSINGSAASDNITDGDGNNLNNLGALTVNADDGDDIVKITTLTENTDTINLGAGDDIVYVGSDYATDVLNGGSGADWFALHHQQGNAGSGLTYTINSGNSSNFENVGGTVGDDNLTGDANANTIFGGKGADIITAGEGNDIVIGDIGTSGSSLSLGSLTYDHNGSGNDKLYGGAGNDDLYGDEGDDTLDGGTGADTIYTGSGSDTVVLRTGDGGSTLAAADIIKDFTDGTDVLGMDDGLQYADLNIAQGTGDNASDTIISSGSEYLAILQEISVSALSEADFTPVDIA